MKNITKRLCHSLYVVRLGLILILSSVLLVSCDDADLARSADGLWYLKLNVKDEYGIPYKENQYLRFQFEESDVKDGGSFRETLQADQSEEEDGIKVTYKVQSTIDGEWEVIWGDLHMTYDLYSLEVKISDMKFSVSDNADIMSQWNALGSVWDLSLSKKQIAEEIRKEVYQNLRQKYELDNADAENEGSCYQDLQIEGDKMSFTTADVERVTLKRISK